MKLLCRLFGHKWGLWSWNRRIYGAGYYRRSCQREECDIHQEKTWSQLMNEQNLNLFERDQSPFEIIFGRTDDD